MARDINHVFISGRLTRDPEFRSFSGSDGTSMEILKFSIANSSKRKEGETNFFDCILWGKAAEIYSKLLSKGDFIVIEGYLKQNRWTSSTDGGSRTKIDIVVLSIVTYNKKSTHQPSQSIPSEDTDTDDSLSFEYFDQNEVKDKDFYEKNIDKGNFDEHTNFNN